MKDKVQFGSSIVALLVNGIATFAVALIWFWPLLSWLKPDTTSVLSWPARLWALGPIIIIIALSITLGGVLRWVFGKTDSTPAMITAALFGPLVAGWAVPASSDLRTSLLALPGDGGILSLAYFGAWLITFTYLMKLPWDRATELLRDALRERFDPKIDEERCKCRCPQAATSDESVAHPTLV